MMTTNFRAAWVLLAAALGCGSRGGQTSSSSHWVACASAPECASVNGAVACEQGHCVDANHQPIDSAGVTTGPSACDPLAPHEQPITMGTLLGAGQAKSVPPTNPGGIPQVFLADHSEAKNIDRVFVSREGDTLFRMRVLGSGQMGGGADVDYNFDFAFDNPPGVAPSDMYLLIQRRGGNVTAVALGGSGKEFIGDGAPGTMLTVVDEAAVAAMKLRNLPGEVTIEYVADVEDGSVIVVTHPRDDYDYTDFRLFHGQQAGLIEYPVLEVVRTKGSDTNIRFSMGAAQLTAHFSFVIGEPQDGGFSSHPGPATLDTGDGKILSVTQRNPTPVALPGSAFTCLH